MNDEQPATVAIDKDIRCLNDGFVEPPFNEGRGEPDAARHPSDCPFDSNTHGAQSHPHAARIRENACPSFSHFLPAEQQIPSGLNALDRIVVSPNGFHALDVKRFERGVEFLIRVANGVFELRQLNCR